MKFYFVITHNKQVIVTEHHPLVNTGAIFGSLGFELINTLAVAEFHIIYL